MIITLPILIPFLYIVLSLLLQSPKLKTVFAVGFALLNLVVSVIVLVQVSSMEMLVTQAGSWPAPYGITLVADRFSAFMLAVAALVFMTVTLYSTQSVDKQRLDNGYFFFAFGILMGVNGSFLAGDIFNLYVWFEVMLMGSFILVSFGGERPQLEGAIKYLILNLISSFFFIAGLGLLYGTMGSLNFADLSQKIAQSVNNNNLIYPSLGLFVVGFAIKGALFPFFFWLPASYHTPPPAATALMAGLLTKVGIYSLIRVYTLFLNYETGDWTTLILWLGLLSMVVGVFTATSQYDFRKILSFHIISQVGYVVVALAFSTTLGLAAAIFFLGHNMLSKTNAFLAAGWVHKRCGTLNIKELGDMLRKNTLWGSLFFISAFSLAGLPPLSGFAGKFLVIMAGIEADYVYVAMIALFVGLFTLFSMVKIWIEVYWKPFPENKEIKMCHDNPVSGEGRMVAASVILALSIIAFGVLANPIIEYCELAAADLLNPQKYIGFIIK